MPERISNSIGHIILIFVVSELVLFGGGRLISVGPITFRMILFTIAQIYTVYNIKNTRVPAYIIGMVFFFIWSLAFSAEIGLFNNAGLDLVISDIKTMSYFVMLIFFYITIDNKKIIATLSKTIKLCSITLAIVYLGVIVAIYLNYLNYDMLYSKQNIFNEIMISDGRIFYKGFLYLCIGFVFFVVDKTKISKTLSIVLLIAIVMTFTRGLLISTLLVYLSYLFIFTPVSARKILLLAAILLTVGLFSSWYFSNVGDRTILSNLPRIITIDQVKEAVSIPSLFFGHGLGIGVNERPEHMEMTYIEIFHKQGILGLLIWIILFATIIIKYSKIHDIKNKSIALPYVLSTVLIYIQTATNPYLNNPIGMGMVLISLTVVSLLGDNRFNLSLASHL